MGIAETTFNPMQAMQPMQAMDGAHVHKYAVQDTEAGNGLIFDDVLRSAVQDVKTTQLDVENKEYLLATGQLSDAHSLPIAAAKAQISLDLLISLRNKAMESYNEMIKISL